MDRAKVLNAPLLPSEKESLLQLLLDRGVEIQPALGTKPNVGPPISISPIEIFQLPIASRAPDAHQSHQCAHDNCKQKSHDGDYHDLIGQPEHIPRHTYGGEYSKSDQRQSGELTHIPIEFRFNRSH